MLRRIRCLTMLLLVGCCLTTLVSAQGGPSSPEVPAAAPDGGEVRVAAVIRDNALTSLDLSYPAVVRMTEISSDVRDITRWTGWALGTPQVQTDRATTAASVPVSEPARVQTVLNDLVWPLVAGLARHGRLTIVVMGAQIATTPLRIETRYAVLEQSGGAGVQTYQAQVKDSGFGSLEDLKQPTAATAAAPPPAPGRTMALAWVLVIIVSICTGIAVYLFMSRAPRRK